MSEDNYARMSDGDVGFGVMHNYARLAISGDDSLGPVRTFLSVGSRSGFQDEYTVTGGTGQGTLRMGFTVTGTRTSANNAGAGFTFQVLPVLNGQLQWAQVRGASQGPDGRYVAQLPFTFGVAAEYMIYFYALAQTSNWRDGGYAEADYGHTALLTRIDVVNAAGQGVPNFGIQSASGRVYSANGVVPTPPVWALLGLGFAALRVRQRGRSRAVWLKP